jgi:hypothetical protein
MFYSAVAEDHRKHSFQQQFLCCWVLIRCRGNLFVCDRCPVMGLHATIFKLFYKVIFTYKKYVYLLKMFKLFLFASRRVMTRDSGSHGCANNGYCVLRHDTI